MLMAAWTAFRSDCADRYELWARSFALCLQGYAIAKTASDALLHAVERDWNRSANDAFFLVFLLSFVVMMLPNATIGRVIGWVTRKGAKA